MREHICGNAPVPLPRASFQMGPMGRAFRAQAIPDACLEHIIEGARRASAPEDIHPWRWIIVRSEGGKQQLAAAVQVQASFSTASVVVMCLADTAAWKSAPQRLQAMVARGELTERQAREALGRVRDYYAASPDAARRTAIGSTFLPLHHMLAAAAECGVSAYWVPEFDEASIKTHFHIPDRFVVAALLTMGYQDEKASAATQDGSSPSVYREKFGEAMAQGGGC